MVVSYQVAHIIFNEIRKYFVIKKGLIGVPKIYLENKVLQAIFSNGAEAWLFSSYQYVKDWVASVEKYLKVNGSSLAKKIEIPIRANYCPEIDMTLELNAEEASYYQSLIGILCWIVELGRIDICL